MSIQRDAFYFDYEPFVVERLLPDDIRTLAAQEDGWVDQARAAMSGDRFAAAESQWSQWLSHGPGYRLLAYNDAFGGNQEDVPEILTEAVGWSPGDNNPEMEPLFEKARDAIANGSLGGEHLDVNKDAPARSGGMGLLLLAAVGLLFLAKRK